MKLLFKLSLTIALAFTAYYAPWLALGVLFFIIAIQVGN